MFFSVVVDNVFELGVNLLVNLHFCVQGLHSSRFSMWGSQNGKYLVKCGKCGRWGSIQWDSTGLYWLKCLGLVFICTVASRCSQERKSCSKGWVLFGVN